MNPALLLLLAGLGAQPSPKPRLVCVITVDQLRPDYLDRYREQLNGGLALLLKRGASFTDAYQDHAVTETAPGHSTILSGRWPAHTGIIRNTAGVPDSTAPLLPERAYHEPDSVSYENSGHDFTFPHRLPTDSNRAALAFLATPGMDSLTLALALEGMRALQLGGRGATDLLAVSLSATDYIGHAYGPDSREMHDQVIRLDRSLGWFLQQLFVRYGSGNVDVVLTADHGITPFPERSRGLGHPGAQRVVPDSVIRGVNAALDARVGGADWFGFESGMLLLPDRSKLAALGVDVDSVVTAVAARLGALPGVTRVDRPGDLARADTTAAVVRRWVHSLPSDASVELVVTLQPYCIWSYPNLAIATHGQPNDFDAHVPLVFWGPGFRRGVYPGRVNTVDIAPTLARLLGLTPSEPLDGRVLTEAIASQD